MSTSKYVVVSVAVSILLVLIGYEIWYEYRQRIPVNSPESIENEPWCNVYFTSHHKTGTFLWHYIDAQINTICHQQQHTLGARSDENIKTIGIDGVTRADYLERVIPATNGRAIIIDFVRIPSEMLVSSYCYHHSDAEKWLTIPGGSEMQVIMNGPTVHTYPWLRKYAQSSIQEMYKAVNPELGLQCEYDRYLTTDREHDIINTFRITDDYEHGYVFRLSEFTYTFNTAINRLLSVLRVPASIWEQVRAALQGADPTSPEAPSKNKGHITRDFCKKEELQKLLTSHYDVELQTLTEKLGMSYASMMTLAPLDIWDTMADMIPFHAGPAFMIHGMLGDEILVRNLVQILSQHSHVMFPDTTMSYEDISPLDTFISKMGTLNVVSNKFKQQAIKIFLADIKMNNEMDEENRQWRDDRSGEMTVSQDHLHFFLGDVTFRKVECTSMPNRLLTFFPLAKQIIILRDPVQRAETAFQLCSEYHRWSDDSFADMTQRQMHQIKECDLLHVNKPKQWRMEHCYTDGHAMCFPHEDISLEMCESYVATGLYDILVKHWRQYYPQLHIVIYNNEWALPVLQQLEHALELPSMFDTAASVSDMKIPLGNDMNNCEDSSTCRLVRQELSVFYQPSNRQLDAILGYSTGFDI